MICPRCGAVSQTGEIRCGSCGASLLQENNEVTSFGGEISGGASGAQKNRLDSRWVAAFYLDRLRKLQLAWLICFGIIIVLLVVFGSTTLILFVLQSSVGESFRDVLELYSNPFLFPVLAIFAGILVLWIAEIVAIYHLREHNRNFVFAFRVSCGQFVVWFLDRIVFRGILITDSFIPVIAVLRMVLVFFFVYFLCNGAAQICKSESPDLARRWNDLWKIYLVVTIYAAFRSFGAVHFVETLFWLPQIPFDYTIFPSVQTDLVTTIAGGVVAVLMVKYMKGTIDALKTLPESRNPQNTANLP